MQFTSALTALTTVLALAATPVFAVDAVVKVMKDVSCNVEAARWRPNCNGDCFQYDSFNAMSKSSLDRSHSCRHAERLRPLQRPMVTACTASTARFSATSTATTTSARLATMSARASSASPSPTPRASRCVFGLHKPQELWLTFFRCSAITSAERCSAVYSNPYILKSCSDGRVVDRL